jgi:MoxR-like ATPase
MLQRLRQSASEQPLRRVLDTADRIVLGKRHELTLALACLLARGHLLIEDVPGVGKTTLAHLLARLLGLGHSRIQFTSDMLPADVVGVSVYDRGSESFRFHKGPIFSHVVLADEINRATPKAQSALLEAMEERQVTAEGETRPLPDPFFVIATQNPFHQIGTFPLPESQLDRFLMRLELGYPGADEEKALLAGDDRRTLVSETAPVMDAASLHAAQQAVVAVHVSDAVVSYVHAILAHTRGSDRFVHGLSPRAGLGLLRAARAWALLNERDFVLPEDVQRVLPAVVPHRLASGDDNNADGHAAIAEAILEAVPVD